MDAARIKATDQFIATNGIIPRAAWGAQDSKITDSPGSSDWDYTTVVIHHSGRWGETNPITIQSKHMNKNGWDDVGYHFMIGPVGQVYEGRRLYFKGSHTENANTGKVGLLVMGNFEKEFLGLLGGVPTPAQLKGADRLIGQLKMLFPTLSVLGGHKDFKVKTECPGNQMYELLGGMRSRTGMIAPR